VGIFFKFCVLNFLFVLSFYLSSSSSSSSSSSACSPGFVQQIMLTAHLLPKDTTKVLTIDRSYASSPPGSSLLYLLS
jgi:hypothetical protein